MTTEPPGRPLASWGKVGTGRRWQPHQDSWGEWSRTGDKAQRSRALVTAVRCPKAVWDGGPDLCMISERGQTGICTFVLFYVHITV